MRGTWTRNGTSLFLAIACIGLAVGQTTCIFKVQLDKQTDFVLLEKVFVTRDKTQYRIDNIEQDKILFSELLQVYLGRDDIYVDPAFQFALVKQILSQYEPLVKYVKLIGRQSVAINKMIYQSILHFGED